MSLSGKLPEEMSIDEWDSFRFHESGHILIAAVLCGPEPINAVELFRLNGKLTAISGVDPKLVRESRWSAHVAVAGALAEAKGVVAVHDDFAQLQFSVDLSRQILDVREDMIAGVNPDGGNLSVVVTPYVEAVGATISGDDLRLIPDNQLSNLDEVLKTTIDRLNDKRVWTAAVALANLIPKQVPSTLPRATIMDVLYTAGLI